MQKYRCTVCDWVYDPTVGDPEHNIPAFKPAKVFMEQVKESGK